MTTAAKLSALFAGWLCAALVAAAGEPPLERSFWLHASLGLFTQRNYFGPQFPATEMPSSEQVANAAHLLGGSYAANRLYLIYHRELPLEEARTLFRWWRAACPAGVELVPALVVRMYDRGQTPIFAADELAVLADFFHAEINSHRVAIYDIAANRESGDAAGVLARRFPQGIVRLGLQPGETIGPPVAAAVADTWSALCHGTDNARDWKQAGFGAETLGKWVRARNEGAVPVAWNLVAVAWDYRVTERGGYPGYDDAEKNMPLPAGRNHAAFQIMRDAADRKVFAGVSSDLYILHENSRARAHDDRDGSFYACLKRGEVYRGYYAAPFHEIVAIFRELQDSGR